jgi:hypothetical protein
MTFIKWGNQYDEWKYDESMIQKAYEALYPGAIDARCNKFYQIFQRWFN